MSTKHSFNRQRRGPFLAWLALAAAGISPAGAQDLVALSPEVELEPVLSGKCAFEPSAFETDGRTVAIWRGRAEDPSGLFARSGPSLEELGPVTQLKPDFLAEEAQVAPLPGGFVAAWTRYPNPQAPEVVFQSFGSDLAPSAPEVVVGPASPGVPPALLAHPDGSFLLAHYGASGTVQIRRYTPAGAPLGPAIEVDPLVSIDSNHLIRLVPGGDGFLVAWAGTTPEFPWGLWIRAFGWDGAPAAASRYVGSSSGYTELAWAQGFYLLLQAGGHHVRGYRLSDTGEFLEDAFDLPAGEAHHPALVEHGDDLWLVYLDLEAGLIGRSIAIPSLTVDPSPQLLVAQPADGQSFIARSSALPGAEGFLAAWQMASTFPVPFPYPPCDETRSLHAQAFGPPTGGVVEVPTLPPPGLLGLALLIAAAGLLLLRRP